MKQGLKFVTKAVVTGLIIILPVYLAALLLLKGMKSVVGLVQPLARLLPEAFPAEKLLSFLLILVICFVIGVAVRTRSGQMARERVGKILTEKMPGFELIRSLTQRMAGKDSENTWKPALIEFD